MSATRRIILASSSPYRRELLARLQLPFSCQRPEVDEAPLPGETPGACVRRLAAEKALRVAAGNSDAIVIGSDQVASLEGVPLNKPGDARRAAEQLRAMRGKRVDFVTGLCVIDAPMGARELAAVEFSVYFRSYSDGEIERYLRIEQPLDCAGSFRAERLGITLVERMQGDDPTALIGLPLIELSRMLRAFGVDVP